MKDIKNKEKTLLISNSIWHETDFITLYKNKIYQFIEKLDFIPDHFQVFQHLLFYYNKHNAITIPLSLFAESIETSNEHEMLRSLNSVLKSNTIQQNDPLFGLFIAYFYYYQDCYALEPYDAIYTQISPYLHTYSKKMEHAEIDLLIAKTEDPSVQSGACSLLGNISIPAEKRELVIKTFINQLNDTDFNVIVYSLEALAKITNFDEKNSWVGEELLNKIKPLNNISSDIFKYLAKLVTDQLAEVFFDKLFDNLSNSFSALKKMGISFADLIISEKKWTTLVDELLTKTDDENSKVRFAAYQLLSNIPISKDKIGTVITKLYSHLRMRQHKDWNIHFKIFAELEYALKEMVIPETSCAPLVNQLLIKLDDYDRIYDKTMAFWLLSKLDLSDEQISTIIPKMFENNTDRRGNNDPSGLEFLPEFLKNKKLSASDNDLMIDNILLAINTNCKRGVIESLELIKIPEYKFQLVFDALLLKIDIDGLSNTVHCQGSKEMNCLKKIIKSSNLSEVRITQVIDSLLEKILDDKHVDYIHLLQDIPIPLTHCETIIDTLLDKTNHKNSRLSEKAYETLGKIEIPAAKKETVLTGMIEKFKSEDSSTFFDALNVIKNINSSEKASEPIIDILLQKKDHRDVFKILPNITIPASRTTKVYEAMITKSDSQEALIVLSRMNLSENQHKVVIEKLFERLTHLKNRLTRLENDQTAYPFDTMHSIKATCGSQVANILDALAHLDIPNQKQKDMVNLLIDDVINNFLFTSTKAKDRLFTFHKKKPRATSIATLIRLEHRQKTIKTNDLIDLINLTRRFKQNIVINSVLSEKIPTELSQKIVEQCGAFWFDWSVASSRKNMLYLTCSNIKEFTEVMRIINDFRVLEIDHQRPEPFFIKVNQDELTVEFLMSPQEFLDCLNKSESLQHKYGLFEIFTHSSYQPEIEYLLINFYPAFKGLMLGNLSGHKPFIDISISAEGKKKPDICEALRFRETYKESMALHKREEIAAKYEQQTFFSLDSGESSSSIDSIYVNKHREYSSKSNQ